MVVLFVIVCDLGAQADLQRRVFFTSCLRDGQLADQEDRSDERGSFMIRPRIADTTFKSFRRILNSCAKKRFFPFLASFFKL